MNDPELQQAEGDLQPVAARAESDWSDSSASDDPLLGHGARRRLTWFALFALLALLLVLLPPLVNVNRYQRRVAQSISQAIGRPVHFDSITAHVLPWPGFTIQNFVVAEDPAFGAEPVLRADVVEARLRVRSLWQRRVEFARIRLQAPSVNLLRRRDGVWNLQSIVTEAGNVHNAPTSQAHAGTAPRFPYVEATAARVNIKLEQDKLPYSLVDTDFALWLPTEQEWQLRLAGRPLRTDTDVSDVGELHIDGKLGRGTPNLAQARLDLRADWKPTPLGEATKLLAGQDAGWRGEASAEVAVHGTPQELQLVGDVHLHNVRRADFVPPEEMQLDAHCEAIARNALHQVQHLRCTLPTRASSSLLESIGLSRGDGVNQPLPDAVGSPAIARDASSPTQAGRSAQVGRQRRRREHVVGPASKPIQSPAPAPLAAAAPGILTLSAELPDTMDLRSASATVSLQRASPEWAMRWMRLFSRRMSAQPLVSGSLDLQLTKTLGTPDTWSGTAICHCSLPKPAGEIPVPPATAQAPPALASKDGWTITGDVDGAMSQPMLHIVAAENVAEVPSSADPPDVPPEKASGDITPAGYDLRFDSRAVAQRAAHLLPALGDSLPDDLNGEIQAHRAWGETQVWAATTAKVPVKRRSRRHPH